MAHRCSLFFPLISLHMALMIICTPIKPAPTYLNSICPSKTMFLPNSSFEMNLKALFVSLASSASISSNNFNYSMAGHKAHDTVYGLFLCRGDLNSTSCKDCVVAAIVALQRSYCPLKKVALIWYNECLVRYSNESLGGKMEDSPKLVIANRLNIIGNQEHFAELLQNMMINLSVRTASDTKKFAIKVVNFPSSRQVVYMLQQCTQDLTTDDCTLCLNIAIRLLTVRIGGRVLLPSCNVWYETTLSNSMSTSSKGNDQLTIKVMVVTLLPLASIMIALLALCLMIQKSKKSNDDDDENGPIKCQDRPCVYGCIYKGKLSSGRKVVVKRLSKRYEQNEQEFKMEVLSQAKVQHRNLVEFIGFCLEGEEKLLVHEYIPNLSLHYFLVDPERRKHLDWNTRYHILCGIARGLLYLDQDSRLRIIHCDLRPLNILLDAGMNAKISHFGLAVTSETQRQRETFFVSYGHMSTEETIQHEFSIKSNVFCFGVLLLAIIGSERYTNLTKFFKLNDAENLLIQAWKEWREGTPLNFLDPTLMDSRWSGEALRCMHLGLLCVQGSQDDRPTMASVVFMLQHGSKVTLQPPEEPAFFFLCDAKPKTSISKEGANTIPCTINTASISKLQPR
ncbi:cysteine-rich receptor-like protein kinase 25 isoform X2 [Spinacia oleracea]|uniref:Cysteine-rich receptor-like protein kinase 25 isoform X2 n=1 Tax=Spinacia oleracea TaxID=3562 RepID=A0A9R0J037_SPIOL|nr:cysteine-rich receptor-like protein kinase 25 isoform X2 [Spinacia oleracea]